MFKKLVLMLLVSISVAGCVDDSSSSAYSYRPPTSIVAPVNYITITKANFSQYFSGGGAQPDNSDCTYAGCKLPSTYSVSFSKKSNFKIETSIIISFTGTASLTTPVVLPNQGSGTGYITGSMTMNGNSNSFSGKYTVNCGFAGCGSRTYKISTPRWDISSISGRIYF